MLRVICQERNLDFNVLVEEEFTPLFRMETLCLRGILGDWAEGARVDQRASPSLTAEPVG